MSESKYERCRTCGQFGWVNTHRCAPKWEWRCDSWHGADEWCDPPVHSRDAEGAALKAAEIYDRDDYTLVRGGEETIWVRQIGTTEISRWCVSAESVPQYHAAESEEDWGTDDAEASEAETP